MNKVWRAGLIPYHIQNGTVRMMFMSPSDSVYGGTLAQIAKGKEEPSDGGSFQVTAMREAGEELGLLERNIVHLEELGLFMTRTYVYIAEVKDRYDFVDPHHETANVFWYTLDDFLQDGRELHKPVVFSAHERILELEELKNVN